MHWKTSFWGRACRFHPTTKGIGGKWRWITPVGISLSQNNSKQSRPVPLTWFHIPSVPSGLWCSHSEEEGILNEVFALAVPASSPPVFSSPTWAGLLSSPLLGLEVRSYARISHLVDPFCPHSSFGGIWPGDCALLSWRSPLALRLFVLCFSSCLPLDSSASWLTLFHLAWLQC